MTRFELRTPGFGSDQLSHNHCHSSSSSSYLCCEKRKVVFSSPNEGLLFPFKRMFLYGGGADKVKQFCSVPTYYLDLMITHVKAL